MNRKLIFTFIGLTFLVTALFLGTPFEFLNAQTDMIATFAIMTLFSILFILLFRQIRRLEHRKTKYITMVLLISLAIPYLYIGVLTTLSMVSEHRPMWQDIKIYTNYKDEKIISQRIEVSGSLYEYRDRKIIADFGNFRISFNYNSENLNGIWKEHNIKKNTTVTVIFDNHK
ncbi:hypothetical protein [Pelobium manganitolerans]|nr:hypothetical protein [Pelobium manganitolerans]